MSFTLILNGDAREVPIYTETERVDSTSVHDPLATELRDVASFMYSITEQAGFLNEHDGCIYEYDVFFQDDSNPCLSFANFTTSCTFADDDRTAYAGKTFEMKRRCR
jgi:hypothetical protein